MTPPVFNGLDYGLMLTANEDLADLLPAFQFDLPALIDAILTIGVPSEPIAVAA